MSGDKQQLKFFKHIVWIDSNQNIIKQLNVFVLLFQDYFEIFKKASIAKAFIQQKDTQDTIVICSSRMIQEVYQAVGNLPNVYPQFIIFCGSAGRAKEVKNNDPYKQVVYNAYWDQIDVWTNLTSLDQQVSKKPQKMLQKIKISPPKVQASPAQAYQNSYITKSHPTKVQKVQQVKPTVKVEKKTDDDTKIIWVIKDDKDAKDIINKIQKQYQVFLSNNGYPIDMKATVDQVQEYESQNIKKNYILIAFSTQSVQDAVVSINNLLLAIMVCENKAQRQTYQGWQQASDATEVLSLIKNKLE